MSGGHLGLLQKSSGSKRAELKVDSEGGTWRADKPFIHPDPSIPSSSLFWHLGPEDNFLELTPEGCQFRIPNELFSGSPTRFALGQCPKVLASERRPVRLGQDMLQDGTTAPGYNPSLVPLPHKLREAVPAGRWLAVLRAGDELWYFSPCKGDKDIHESQSVQGNQVTVTQTLGAILGIDEVVDETSRDQDRLFGKLPRSFVVILDEDFELITKAQVTMRNKDSVLDEASIQDVRIISLNDGQLLAGYHPNYLYFSKYGHGETNWPGKEFVAILHVEVGDSGLEAWLDRNEVHEVHECPELGLHAPGSKHNMGWLKQGDAVYGVDWVYPTRVGRVHVEELRAPLAPILDKVPPLCFGWDEELEPPPPRKLPWEGLRTMTFGFEGPDEEDLRPHNGSPLVFVEEIGEFLGVAHLERKFLEAGWPLPQYSQQFYTISGDPSRGKPFQLSRVSGEFCFESAAKEGDCDRVQLVSSLVRTGDRLQLGYGVMDCESFVTTMALTDVLDMMQTV